MNDPEPQKGPDRRAVNDPEPQKGPDRRAVNDSEPRRGGRRRGGRRADDGQIVVICWRDIPAQVNAGSGEDRVQRILPRRFQRAIDRAAMVAGKTQASEYVGEWRRVLAPGDPDDPEAAAAAAAARLEDEFPRSRLDAFVAAGGWDPDGDVTRSDAEPGEVGFVAVSSWDPDGDGSQGADQKTGRGTAPSGDPDSHQEAAT